MVQTKTVAIACPTGIHALLLSRRGGCEGTRGNISIPRLECSNTRREKRSEDYGDDDKQPLAAFHDLVLEIESSSKMSMAHSRSAAFNSLGTAHKLKCQGMILTISYFPS
jgi:hypothetical protein